MKGIFIRLNYEEIEALELMCEGKTANARVQNLVKNTILNKKQIEDKIKEYKEKIKKLYDLLDNNPLFNPFKIPQSELDYLIETVNVLNKPDGMQYLNGRKDAYNNQFNKGVSLHTFKLLLDSVEKEVMNGTPRASSKD